MDVEGKSVFVQDKEGDEFFLEIGSCVFVPVLLLSEAEELLLVIVTWISVLVKDELISVSEEVSIKEVGV